MKCPLCGNTNNFIYIESIEDYKIYKCPECFLEFSFPLKSAPPSHYEKFEKYSERWEFEKVLDFIPFKNAKILDIGCGEGYFLKLAKEKGFEAFGIDFNEKAIEIAKEKFGLKNVYPYTIEEFIEKFPNEKFDIICFFHLLEHLDDPLKFMKNIKKILKENGYIAFSLPNPKRFSLYFNLRETWDFPPHHLTRWDEKSINKLLNITGFEIFKKEYEPLKIKEILEGGIMIKKSFGIIKKLEDKKDLINNKQKIRRRFLINILKKIKKFILYPFALYNFIKLKKKGIYGTNMLIIAKIKK
jgi:2-polyprenyl-3-methyl-5-hydroxy-6-metoxy-1,4-benzoquinol methylase